MNAAPFYFFGLVFLLSIPFWLFDSLVSSQLLPGLPVSAIMPICPGLAAAILVLRAGDPAALRSFLYRVGDCRRMRPRTWFVSLGTMPVVMVLSAAILIATGNTIPPPDFDLIQTLALFCVFFVAAIGEELGWTAYATAPMVKNTV